MQDGKRVGAPSTQAHGKSQAGSDLPQKAGLREPCLHDVGTVNHRKSPDVFNSYTPTDMPCQYVYYVHT
jgi:hypothetical protein